MSRKDFADLLWWKITLGDLRRAANDIDNDRPHNFRPAREWRVIIAGRPFDHRPLIAFAAERHLGRVLTNDDRDFDGNKDKECRRFFEAMEFVVKDKRKSSTLA